MKTRPTKEPAARRNNKSGGSGEGARRGNATAVTESINRVFAKVEQAGVWAGLALVVTGFALYTSGMLAPYLSIEELTRNWGLDSRTFVERTGMPSGWEWVALLGHSDILALAGLIALSSIIVAAYAFMAWQWAKHGDLKYLLLSLLQLAVFALAASGVLDGGH